MCHHKSWLKKCQPGIERMRGITSCWLRTVVGEVLSVKMCQKHTCMSAKSSGEEEARQIVRGAPNVRAGIKVMVALPGARQLQDKKGKLWFESLGMILFTYELGISDSCLKLKNSQMGSKSRLKMLFQVRKSSYLDLMMKYRTFHTSKPCRRSFYAGSARSSSDLWQRSQFQRLCFFDWKQTNPQRMLFCQHRQIRHLLCCSYLINTIAPSPQWLQTLMNEGIRPINNVADVTNYPTLLWSAYACLWLGYIWRDWYSAEARRWKLVTLDGKCVTWKQMTRDYSCW